MPAVEWPAHIDEEEVRARIERRASSLRWRRRAPIGVLAVTGVLGLSLMAGGTPTDSTSLRTADEDTSTIIEDERNVGVGGARAEARTKVWTGPAGGRFEVEADTGAPVSRVGITGEVNPSINRYALTSHPLVLDPAGDADGRDAPSNAPVPAPRNDPFADLRSFDFELTPDDRVLATITVQSLNLSSLPERDTVLLTAYGVLFTDVELRFQAELAADGTISARSHVKTASGGTVQVFAPARVEGNSLVFETTLDEINRRLDSTNFTARRAQGELVVRRGTQFGAIAADSAVFRYNGVLSVARTDDVARPAAGSYWAFGD